MHRFAEGFKLKLEKKLKEASVMVEDLRSELLHISPKFRNFVRATGAMDFRRVFDTES